MMLSVYLTSSTFSPKNGRSTKILLTNRKICLQYLFYICFKNIFHKNKQVGGSNKSGQRVGKIFEKVSGGWKMGIK